MDNFFQEIEKKDLKFSEIFATLANSGAGKRALNLEISSWTPAELASALSGLSDSQSSIEVRTVYYWFQGGTPSKKNIVRLANVFSGGKPTLSRQLLVILLAAQNRDKAANLRSSSSEKNERQIVMAENQSLQREISSEGSPPAKAKLELGYTTISPSDASSELEKPKPKNDTLLARLTHHFYLHEVTSTLPIPILGGALCLILAAYSINAHSIHIPLVDGTLKQIGYVWAANWTITFLILLPLFVSLVSEHIRLAEKFDMELSFLRRSSSCYWVIFFGTFIIASCLNWYVAYYKPVTSGDIGKWVMDWGRIAIEQPDRFSTSSTLAFSGVVFLYNGICAYLFFVGQLYIYQTSRQFNQHWTTQADNEEPQPHWSEAAFMQLRTYRICALGLLIVLTMKLQSAYMGSLSENILVWLADDAWSAITLTDDGRSVPFVEAKIAGHLYSFICLICVTGTYAISSINLRHSNHGLGRLALFLDASILLLIFAYIAIGLVPGFSLILLLAVALTLYPHKPRPGLRKPIRWKTL